MAQAIFPARRDDGTTSVGARFDVNDPDARRLLNDHAESWPCSVSADPLDALSAPPTVQDVSESVVEVVFEGEADNRLWKDALVAFMSRVPPDAGEFPGFYDRVGGRMHPASVITTYLRGLRQCAGMSLGLAVERSTNGR